jgi:hypothetical protein
MRRLLLPSCALAVAIACVVAVAAADKGSRTTEAVWQAPDFASFDVRSIALLPAATYDANIEARRLTEYGVGTALRGTGYRWTSTLITRDQLARAGGDSLLKALNEQLLKYARVDSLQAPFLCRATRSRALLTVRVDRFERLQLEFNQAGKPTTTVQLHAALVDSTGRLLWTASGSETAEGPYQDPSAGTGGVNASGLNNTPMSNQGGAPSYQETLNRLLARWTPHFPARAATPAN